MAFGDRCQPPANCARMAPSSEPRASGRFDESLAGDPIAEEQHFVLSITKSNGVGMRLSTWCSIVEAHEGRLWVISNSPIVTFFNLEPQRPPTYFRKCNADPSSPAASQLRSEDMCRGWIFSYDLLAIRFHDE
jgi:hypothetical protein